MQKLIYFRRIFHIAIKAFVRGVQNVPARKTGGDYYVVTSSETGKKKVEKEVDINLNL